MKEEINYKGWIIKKNEYNLENNCYLNYEYYNTNDSDSKIRHCISIDDCKESIDYLINEYYY